MYFVENALILSQTIFYFSASVAIIVIGIIFSVGTYHLTVIVKELEAITRDIHDFTGDAEERIRDILERLSHVPLLSFFLKRKKRESSKPERKKGHGKN